MQVRAREGLNLTYPTRGAHRLVTSVDAGYDMVLQPPFAGLTALRTATSQLSE